MGILFLDNKSLIFISKMVSMKDLYARNPRCCECGATSPRWASINLGVVFCMDCSGIHRQMGTHISKVKSCTLDNWHADWIKLICNVGNEISNAYFEYSMPQEYAIDSKSIKHYNASRMREKIFNKYNQRKWTPPNRESPAELYLKGGKTSDSLPQSDKKISKEKLEVVQKPASNERKQLNTKVDLLDCPSVEQVNTAKSIAAVEDVKRASVEPDLMGFSQNTFPLIPLANHTYDKLDDLLNDLEYTPSQQQDKAPVAGQGAIPKVSSTTNKQKSKPKDPFLSLLD